MSLPIVPMPNLGEDWFTFVEQVEGLRKGRMPLSLTNYDNNTVPQIASGSWIEVIGAVFKTTSNQTITGSLTSNAINYITMVPSGAGASAILTPTWASGAPTWSDAYQGYFSGTTRYAGGCYYDGTNYLMKWVYTNRHAGPKTHYIHPSLTGWSNNANITLSGFAVQSFSPTGGNTAQHDVAFPPHGRCIITELETYCDAYTDGTHTFNLTKGHKDGTSPTTIATTAHTGTGTLIDTSISEPVVDLDAFSYYINYIPSSGATATMESIRVKFVEVMRC